MKPYTTLIEPQDLFSHLGDPDWAVIDCRFSLAEPGWGRENYLNAHIPGAVYAHLDEDLCGPILPGVTGRHPLPTIAKAARVLSEWGIDARVQVVAYDDAGGAMAAARLWWMLQWLGHSQAAVLNGGWQRWLAEGLPVQSGTEVRPPRNFQPNPRPELVVDAREIETDGKEKQMQILDVRTGERFRGENEPIDPVAGHIPGAISAPYQENLDAGGRFLPPEALHARFQRLIGDLPPGQVVFYCGSGVTAAQSVLALAYAGLGEARLYAGSWSEWITDPERPVAAG
jgi:thiosulfate/3-mercaptopyruvate sulfurtransferase